MSVGQRYMYIEDIVNYVIISFMQECSECRRSFEFLPGELALHEKIVSAFSVGRFDPPLLCPPCRLQRKMAWRNERFLYRRPCSHSGKEILSVYPAETPFPVYERNVWWSDVWDAITFAREFDFNRSFFEQFGKLQKVVPRSALNSTNVENCDYCNFSFDCRNCYLSHCSYAAEGLLNCYFLLSCRDCLDCSYCFESERCVLCTDCNHSYGCVRCVLSHSCVDSLFLFDCRGCTECFGCVGLRKKTHCFFNEQLTKEEYEKRRREFDLQNPTHVKAVQERMQTLKLKHPHLYSVQEKTENCTGDYIFESKNCEQCFQVYRSHDCMYVHDAETKDALHCYHPGWSELTYETFSSVSFNCSAFSVQCWTGSSVFYSDNCQSCNDCFGCIGLKHKQYCILNKQYTKEEYGEMIKKISAHMKKEGEWGVFFPVTLSPFAYNETLAVQDFPMTEEEVKARGWRWTHDHPMTTGKETIKREKVPARIQDIPETIVKEIFACESCQRNYRTTTQELKFLRDFSLPFPRQCPECRYAERMKLRNPRTLWDRQCMKCSKKIQTTYGPERPEIIYCEECYLASVY